MKRVIVVLCLASVLALTGCQSTPKETPPPTPTDDQAISTPIREALPGRGEVFPDGSERQMLSGKEELIAFAEYVNTAGEAQNTDVIWTLENDIDLSGVEWKPIGYFEWNENDGMAYLDKYGFKGKFDGQNHSITGLKVVGDQPRFTGFFGVLTGNANVRNLHIQGDVVGESGVGGLAGMGGAPGEEHRTFIENCSFTGTVQGLANGVGGLIGEGGENTVINSSYAQADVTGQSQVGGFVGSANNRSMISDCYFRGTVNARLTADTEKLTGLTHIENLGDYPEGAIVISAVGGFAGGTYNADINNCYSDGMVKAFAPSSMLGAFVGYHSGNDSACYYNTQLNPQWIVGYPYPGTNTEFTAKGIGSDAFKKAETFAEFDFERTWCIDESTGFVALQKAEI